MDKEIQEAIGSRQILKFDYVAKDLEITKDRLVLPIEMKIGSDGEYNAFLGYDLNKDGLRAFQLEGIQKLKTVLNIMVTEY